MPDQRAPLSLCRVEICLRSSLYRPFREEVAPSELIVGFLPHLTVLPGLRTFDGNRRAIVELRKNYVCETTDWLHSTSFQHAVLTV